MAQAIILIGAGRSGTKFLRDTLASSDACACVPYDVNYVWRYGNEGVPHDVLPPEAATKRVKQYVPKTLARLAKVQAQNADFLIEKTVSNTLRVPFVHEVLPDAKYVHIIRDGRDVTESSARMWTEPPEYGYLLQKLRYFPISNVRYALWYAKNMIQGALGNKRGQKVWGPRYPGIDHDAETLSVHEVCARQWQTCVDSALQGLELIPADKQLTVRYEALVSGPEAFQEICEFIGIPDTKRVVEAYTKTLRKDTRGKWRDGLTPEVQARVLEIIEPTLLKLGYALDEA